jgi:tungstate transport system ATP-binding protein
VAEALLALRNIRVRYGDTTALELDDLEVPTGVMLAVIGPNGSGKSTLLRVIGLLQRPSSGMVLFRGQDAFAGNTLLLRRRIATVFQEPLLLNATVQENAALGLRLRGASGREIALRLEPWLERLGIAHLRARLARTLSGGEAQRTSLARALALQPDILLLDEPFAALDPVSRESLLGDFQSIIRGTGITTVFVTHDRSEAFSLGSRVAVLHRGRLLQIGAGDEVFFRPRSEATAEIVGIENRLSGVVEAAVDDVSVMRVGHNVLEVPGRFKLGTRVILCLRPETVVVRHRQCQTSDSSSLAGKIVKISPGMLHQRVILQCGGIEIVALVRRTGDKSESFAEGDDVSAWFDPGAAHVIEP